MWGKTTTSHSFRGRTTTDLIAKPQKHYTTPKWERDPILNPGQGKNRYTDHKSMRVTHIHISPGVNGLHSPIMGKGKMIPYVNGRKNRSIDQQSMREGKMNPHT